MNKKRRSVVTALLAAQMLLSSVPMSYAAEVPSLWALPQYDYQKLDEHQFSHFEASSFEPEKYNEGPVHLAFDGNVGTAWHTAYNLTGPTHFISWDLGDSYLVDHLIYKLKTGQNNGKWNAISVTVNPGTDTEQEVFRGNVNLRGDQATIKFQRPVQAKTIRVDIQTTNGSQPNKFASAGEIEVYQAILKNQDITAASVAQIGNYGYNTVEEAFQAAETGDTISLLKDSSIAPVSIANKSVVLDLQGFTLSGKPVQQGTDRLNYNLLTVESTGGLTVQDSSAGKTGKLLAQNVQGEFSGGNLAAIRVQENTGTGSAAKKASVTIADAAVMGLKADSAGVNWDRGATNASGIYALGGEITIRGTARVVGAELGSLRGGSARRGGGKTYSSGAQAVALAGRSAVMGGASLVVEGTPQLIGAECRDFTKQSYAAALTMGSVDQAVLAGGTYRGNSGADTYAPGTVTAIPAKKEQQKLEIRGNVTIINEGTGAAVALKSGQTHGVAISGGQFQTSGQQAIDSKCTAGGLLMGGIFNKLPDAALVAKGYTIQRGTLQNGNWVQSSTGDQYKVVSTSAPEQIKVTGVSLNQSSVSLKEGGSVTLTATVSPAQASNQTVVWASSNPSAATVNAGTVKAVSAGETTITVTSQDGGYTASCKVIVTADGGSNRPDSGNRPNSNSSGSHTVEKNPDGSVTTTEIKPDGTKVETTKKPNGDKIVVETKKDGSTTTEVKLADGTTAVSKTDADGKTKVEVHLSAEAVEQAGENRPVVVPVPPLKATEHTAAAPEITVITGTSAPVEIKLPMVKPSGGVVAVIVHKNGTEEVVRKTIVTEDGVILAVADGTTVKLVDNSKHFRDVSGDHWARNYVDFVTARNLFNGTSRDSFSPTAPMTRGQLMTVLARLENVDTSTDPIGKGIAWAVKSGISDGSNPSGTMSRQQLATMLWRYAGRPASKQQLTGSDVDAVAGYAKEAMAWAVEQGILSGYADGTLKPENTASRAHVAAMVTRFVNQ